MAALRAHAGPLRGGEDLPSPLIARSFQARGGSSGTALELDPDGLGYRGQLGLTYTLANQLGAAAREYAAALEQQPDDYVSLTGRALLALKQGREGEAIELLLRVTLFEPRYARAHMYLGVAYYRQRRVENAIRELQLASREDPRDPLPYMMLTQIHTGLYEPWKAIESARAHRCLLPANTSGRTRAIPRVSGKRKASPFTPTMPSRSEPRGSVRSESMSVPAPCIAAGAQGSRRGSSAPCCGSVPGPPIRTKRSTRIGPERSPLHGRCLASNGPSRLWLEICSRRHGCLAAQHDGRRSASASSSVDDGSQQHGAVRAAWW